MFKTGSNFYSFLIILFYIIIYFKSWILFLDKAFRTLGHRPLLAWRLCADQITLKNMSLSLRVVHTVIQSLSFILSRLGANGFTGPISVCPISVGPIRFLCSDTSSRLWLRLKRLWTFFYFFPDLFSSPIAFSAFLSLFKSPITAQQSNPSSEWSRVRRKIKCVSWN